MAHPESTKKPTDFAAYQQFTSKAGELFIGKHSVSSLAKIAEQTPFYVYHKDSLNKRVEILRQALPETIELHYAIKSNPMPELIQHLSKVVDGFDVASGGELQVCLDAGILADKMSFAGPGKSLAELELAITNGVLINCESSTELERIDSISKRQKTTAKVALRVNPDFTLKSSGMKMGGGPQQFGIDAEIIPEVLAKIPNLNIEFIGFHIFSGSQNLQAESLIECQNKTIELAIKLSQLAPTQPKLINIGGGFGIPYFKGEKDLDVAAVGINLQHQLNHFHKFFPNCKIALELGRYISGPAGLYVCEVTDIKVSRGKKYLISNGGLHHHLAASGNFGQIIRKNYPVTIATKMDSEELEEVSIVGPLCTPLDLLADKMLLPKAEIGDLVVVYQSGAYGFSASPGKFLNHPEVVELLI
jgi:diaminopimelate decarboxylase